MNKQNASFIVNKNIIKDTPSLPLLNAGRNGNVCWANINIAKDVWWIDIPIKKFINHLHLILNDKSKNIFYWISINANNISDPYNKFRKLRENYISIELSSREINKFVDIKSGGTNFNFKIFKITKFDHPEKEPNENLVVKNVNLAIDEPTNEKGYLCKTAVKSLETDMTVMFEQLSAMQLTIREKLKTFCNGKTLKGNELVGWLGEIYGKLLFDGTMVDDSYEHDIESSDRKRVSIKTRKGWKSGWTQSSAIPKITGDDCPTHLLFVHLDDDYSIHGMWLFDWHFLTEHDRFRKHMVRGNMRSYIFHLNESKDQNNKIFP